MTHDRGGRWTTVPWAVIGLVTPLTVVITATDCSDNDGSHLWQLLKQFRNI